MRQFHQRVPWSISGGDEDIASPQHRRSRQGRTYETLRSNNPIRLSLFILHEAQMLGRHRIDMLIFGLKLALHIRRKNLPIRSGNDAVIRICIKDFDPKLEASEVNSFFWRSTVALIEDGVFKPSIAMCPPSSANDANSIFARYLRSATSVTREILSCILFGR